MPHAISIYSIELSVSATVILVVATTYFAYKRYFSVPTLESAKKIVVPVPDEAQPHWKGKRLSPISIRNAAHPDFIQSYCPATGQHLGQFKSTTSAEIDAAIEAAGVAQKEWAHTTFAARRQVLRTLSDYILKNQASIARVACRDSGKTMVDASMGEILVTLEKANWIIKYGEKTLRVSRRPGAANPLMGYKGAEVRYEPMGVVASMVSWNYPFHNLMGPVLAAIFTGNAIVVKCSEQVVWSSQYFIEIIKMALKVCGHDPSLVQLVCCWPEDADHLTAHPQLAHITFIGSKPVAHHVLAAAAKTLTPVVVELGGKDALIVLDDVASIADISSIVMRGTFQSLGQNCIGIERVIAVGKAYDALVDTLAQRIPKLRLGSDIDQLEGIDMGALISNNRFAHIETLVERAVAQGARLVCGGAAYQHPNYPQGHYFEPTLLVDVLLHMEIAQEEVFGPVCVVMRADSAAHAVTLANNTPFGLGASVFGGNWNKCNEIANQLRAGNVAINDFATYYLCQLPFGGVGGSGYGKFGGEEGLLGLMVAKSVCYDRLPGIKTKIPAPLDYPIASDARAWGFVEGLNRAGYDGSLWGKWKGLRGLIKNA
ncbi:hypothetical protein BABINDRAFT_33305 [Babjeviella inositovora NRRL Y-12698]|uniref:Aldehyde dehydrogenase domain-containing protein n=1 Tax=Babjeviella inositovora NRRL Y-12698 TaxID=984486 RepID=A0A1E3QVQ7_9ASCO|nr:uncharacterized protein BABINDRAFT_33305 [Babjeviella inositovora NRRL Y-12698]ODQ81745.1 hypothetical protein BABINDRAFT_33305 [Babjeviella inositovora NRRL Y-12698]